MRHYLVVSLLLQHPSIYMDAVVEPLLMVVFKVVDQRYLRRREFQKQLLRYRGH